MAHTEAITSKDAGLTRGRVELDHGPAFDAWIRPTRWNGWACPLLSHEACVTLAAAIDADREQWSLRMHFDGRAWVVTNDDDPDHPEVNDPILVNGVAHFEIGSPGWCWWPDDEPEPDYVPVWGVDDGDGML